MQIAMLIKSFSIGFAILGASTALWAPRLPIISGEDPDRVRRRQYLVSYALTTVSVLLLAATPFF